MVNKELDGDDKNQSSFLFYFDSNEYMYRGKVTLNFMNFNKILAGILEGIDVLIGFLDYKR